MPARQRTGRQQSINSDLTELETRFVEEYMIDLNAKQAYVRAGGKNTQGSSACLMLQRPRVQAAINVLKTERRRKMEIDHEAIIKRLANIAFADRRGFVDSDGVAKKLAELPDDLTDAVEVEVCESMRKGADGVSVPVAVKKIKTADKLKAMELMCRMLGLLNDKTTVKHELEELSDEQLKERIKRLTGVA